MRHPAFPLVVLRAVLAASLLPLVALTGCGGGGGGGGLFPDSAPTDLVALTADVDDDGERILQLVVMDVHGRGSEVLTNFQDPSSGGLDREGLVWSPDHQRVAFVAQPDGEENLHIFVAHPQTGIVIDATGSFPEVYDGAIRANTLCWSPDGTRLAFQILQNTASGSSIVLVSADGAGLVDLRAVSPLGETSHPEAPVWAPDSSRVAYVTRLPGGAGERVFTALKDGSGIVDVTASPTPVLNANVLALSWSPDAALLALSANLEVVSRVDAYVVPGDGSVDPRRVSLATAVGAVNVLEWAPDGSRLAYRADAESLGTQEVFTVLPDGSEHVKVSGSCVAGGSTATFFWSPDSSRIAFHADRLTNEVSELFTVTPTGTKLLRVSVPLVAGGDAFEQNGTFGQALSPWSPDGTRLAYVADAIVDGTDELFVVSPDGTDSDQLTAAVPGARIFGFSWNPDSRFLSFIGEVALEDVSNAFIADTQVGAGPPLQVTFAATTDEEALGFDWGVDGTRYVFGQEFLGGLVVRSNPREVLDVFDLSDLLQDVEAAVTR
jgi:Tol biopolymer transport system component